MWGNPKTLTPGPLTPTTDRVRGLPTDRSTDYSYGPLHGPTPQNSIRIINISVTDCLIDCLCRRNFKRYMLCANVTDLRSRLVASYIITHCYFLCHGHTVDETPENHQEAPAKPLRSLEICALKFPSTILFNLIQLIFQWIQASQFAQQNYRYNKLE